MLALMTDVGRAAAAVDRPDAWPIAPRRRQNGFARGQCEAEPRGDRIGFLQSQPQLLADSVARPSLLACERARGLVIAETFRAERRDRHQPVPAQPLDRG